MGRSSCVHSWSNDGQTSATLNQQYSTQVAPYNFSCLLGWAGPATNVGLLGHTVDWAICVYFILLAQSAFNELFSKNVFNLEILI